jgi:hypothetical protein
MLLQHWEYLKVQSKIKLGYDFLSGSRLSIGHIGCNCKKPSWTWLEGAQQEEIGQMNRMRAHRAVRIYRDSRKTIYNT